MKQKNLSKITNQEEFWGKRAGKYENS